RHAHDAILHDGPDVLTIHAEAEVVLEGIRKTLSFAEYKIDRLEGAQVIVPLLRSNARRFADRARPPENGAGDRAVAGSGHDGRLFDELRCGREADGEQRNQARIRQYQVRRPIGEERGDPGTGDGGDDADATGDEKE